MLLAMYVLTMTMLATVAGLYVCVVEVGYT